MDPTFQQKPQSWQKNISIFLISQQFSIFGSSVASFAIIWYITLETSSGVAITGVTIAAFLPQILTSLFAGVWADRYNRKLLIIFPDLFIAATTLLLVVLFWMGIKSIALLILISALRSFGSGVQMPSVSAIVPQLVPADQLIRINGINSTLNSILLLASPAVAGILLGSLGIEFALLTDVVTALFAVGFMSFLRLPERRMKFESENTGAFRDILAGLKYTKDHPFLLRLMVIYAIIFVMITPAAFLTPLYVERTFGPEVWRLTLNEITWMISTWLEAYDTDFVEELLKAGNETPELTIRLNTLRTSKEDLTKALTDRGFKVSEGKYSGLALNVRGSFLLESEFYNQGLFSVQDEASQMVVEKLDPQAGETVVDVCAAPGGKTLAIAEKMHNIGKIVASDIYKRKLDIITKESNRLGVSIIETKTWDGTKVDSALVGKADRVLVDAPCSGLGVVRRKPEIKFKKYGDEMAGLPTKQLAILSASSYYVKPGGVLLYST